MILLGQIYVNLKNANLNHYKMPRVSLKVKEGPQEGTSYKSLPWADCRKDFGAGEVFVATRGSVPT